MRGTVSGSNWIKCSGVPPHQSLSAWRLCRITQCWVVEKHRWVDSLLSTELSCPRDVRQASVWLYFQTTKPSYPLRTNFASPSTPLETCLIVWMKDPAVKHLLPATAWGSTSNKMWGKQSGKRRTSATLVKVTHPFKAGPPIQWPWHGKLK